MLAALTANLNRDRKKKRTEYKWYEFMPQWSEKYRKLEHKSPDELKKFFDQNVMPHFGANRGAQKK